MRKILLCLAIGLFSSQTFAQTREIATCGNEYSDGLNEQVSALLQANRTTTTTGVIYRIPVVFHVLTDQPSGVSNISDCIIQNQITILNNCFRRKTGAPNTNAAGADAEIEFYLARKNNIGAAISGINRVNTPNCNYTSVGSTTQISNIRGAVSASTNWPNNKYLNIFVLKTMPTSGSIANGVRGQAWYGGSNMGVFIHYSYVGSKNSGCPNLTYLDATNFDAYDLGMTLVHEVGHYLNLLHTYGSNCSYTDFCGDTPAVTGLPEGVVGTSNTNCNKNDSRGVCNTSQKRMWQNYLDYTDDVCMDRFTPDQVTRMRAVLTSNSQYTNIVSSGNFTATGGDVATSVRNINGATTPTLQVYPNPFSKEILINLENKNQPVSYQITNIFGQSVQTGQLLRNQKSLDLGHLSPGVYFIKANNETIKIIKQ
ncbi:MAG: zinc-dependent metalloprotease [Lacibacter sp.]